MKNLIKTIALLAIIVIVSCKEDQVGPTSSQRTTVTDTASNPVDTTTNPVDTSIIDTTVIDTTNPVITEVFFTSVLDDSLTFTADSVDSNGYLYLDYPFQIRLEVSDTNSVQLGLYTNQFLVTNTDFGIRIHHSVYVGDGSVATMYIGESSTQINTLEVTKIQNNSVWIEFNVDWTYTHWLYTEKNKSGTITGELNGFKYR